MYYLTYTLMQSILLSEANDKRHTPAGSRERGGRTGWRRLRMKRILPLMMLAALIAITTHAGPLEIDGSRISPLSSIESIGSLEIHLKIRIIPDSTQGTRVVIIDEDGTNETAYVPASAGRRITTSRGDKNHSPIGGVRDGFAIARALRCAARALFDFLISHTTGS